MTRTFLYLDEVARECRTSVSTVRHWIAVGRLRSIRPGRRLLVTREDLDAFLDASTRKPRTIERASNGERSSPRPPARRGTESRRKADV